MRRCALRQGSCSLQPLAHRLASLPHSRLSFSLILTRTFARPPLPQLLLNFKRWRVDQYQKIVGQITPESLTAYIPRLLGRLFIEALLVGNLTPGEASAMLEDARTKLTSAWGVASVWPGEEKDLRIVKLPAGVSSVLVEAGPNAANENSAVWVTYQVWWLRRIAVDLRLLLRGCCLHCRCGVPAAAGLLHCRVPRVHLSVPRSQARCQRLAHATCTAWHSAACTRRLGRTTCAATR